MVLIIITAILIVIQFFISIYFDLAEYDQSPFELLNKTSDNWKTLAIQRFIKKLPTTSNFKQNIKLKMVH